MPYSNPEKRKARRRLHFPPSGIPHAASRDRGAAGEHFVIHWLLARGFQVGGPYNQNGKHDLFVKVGRWRTVQVKVARVSVITGHIYTDRNTRSSITSDLVAWVDLAGHRIRWQSHTSAPLPPELTNET